MPGRTDPLATPPGLLASPPGLLATPPGSLEGCVMDQAAVDALVYWAGAFFLGGFAVGVIVKLLLGRTE